MEFLRKTQVTSKLIMSQWGIVKEIMKHKFNFTLLIISLICLCALSAGSIYEPSSENVNVIFVIDNSGSMANNDPEDLRFAATKLFISLLDQGDTVGTVIFSNEAKVLHEGIVTITSMQTKLTLTESIHAVTPDGYTDVKAAFLAVSELVQSGSKNSDQSIIIFLTDGQPEPVNFYTSYEQDTIDLIGSLNIPVISVALTNHASVQFLAKVSSQTDGKLYSAKSYLDLIDVYLDILGQWKDRTIIGEGEIPSPSNKIVNIDLGLAPYLTEISFVVTKDEKINVSLLNPDGQIIEPNDPEVTYYQGTDPDYAVITIADNFPGDWQVDLSGEGQAQLRVIISSNLKADLFSGNNLAETGQPMLIEAQILELDQYSTPHRVIGEGQFSAVITWPDGTQEAIDQLFDDGTHGDITADDGLFSRLYPNTTVPGTYSIELRGYKGLIPLSTKEMVTLISVPDIVIESPQSEKIAINSGESVDISVRIGESQEEALDSGTVTGKIIDESGKITIVELVNNENLYTGHFEPSKTGHYTLDTYVDNGYCQTLPYLHTSTLEFEVQIIPSIAINLMAGQSNILVENQELVEGVPVQVKITSTASEVLSLTPTMEGPSGVYLEGPSQITLTSNETIYRDLWLKSDSSLGLGAYDLQIVFSTLAKVNFTNASIPIRMTVFEPTITVLNVQPIGCEEPIGCLNWKSNLELTISSSSRQSEVLYLALLGDSSIKLVSDEIIVEPGQGEYQIDVTNTKLFTSGMQEFDLLLETEKDSVGMEEDTQSIPVRIELPSLFSRCKKVMLWTGLIILGTIVITIKVIGALKQRQKRSFVTGTLRIWTDKNRSAVSTFDLTAMSKRQLLIGSDPSCDVFLERGTSQSVYFKLVSQVISGRSEIVLIPVEEVKQKYNYVVNELKLENEIKFSVENNNFQYLSDSGY
ncbi:VWA domain-containing protein [Chloroflexota bacterium]|nr:VWA domain-containing protein [Chloroflexota bacterium]